MEAIDTAGQVITVGTLSGTSKHVMPAVITLRIILRIMWKYFKKCIDGCIWKCNRNSNNWYYSNKYQKLMVVV